MIAIIDYDAGNLRSVEKAFEFLGYEAQVSKDKEFILEADAVVLPGVGAFGDGMVRLKQTGMDRCIYDLVEQQRPFLGICLGMQLLFETSEENGNQTGLGILPGNIRKIPAAGGLKVPQIGWNSLHFTNQSPAFKGLCENSYVYFVHSYYLQANKRSDVIAQTQYGVNIDAAVSRGSVTAFQFHPEKSGEVGLTMLQNLAKSWGIQKK